MISTRNLIAHIMDVPSGWIFEYYLNIPGQLAENNTIKIKSMFSANDKDPSFCIYGTKGIYKFKDFSADIQGNGVVLVKHLFHLSLQEAALKILFDYREFIKNNAEYKIPVYNDDSKYELTAFSKRRWSVQDKLYWSRFHISLNILKFFNVFPISEFTVSKIDKSNVFTVINSKLYAYTKKDGSIYKIYQPFLKNKFFKVSRHIQGGDQLTYTKPYLLICSSLKDMAAFTVLGFTSVEVIAPESENTIIRESTINYLKSKYKQVCVLLDNDTVGIDSMHKYHEQYDLPYILFKLEKDLADNNEAHGIESVRELLYPLLTKAFTGVTKEL